MISCWLEQILIFYNSNGNLINLIKDIIYFAGAFALVRYLWNWRFIKQKERMDANLRFRERIESTLEAHVFKENKNGIKDIGIRFVYWKNYPDQLEEDGFKHLLRLEYHNEKLLGSGWLDSTGIYFQEHFWFRSTSIYVDALGLFFFAPSGRMYSGFTEHPNACLVMHLPFTNIINFDFREKIEYEPVFYTKYPHSKHQKLYSDYYIIRERLSDSPLHIKLNRRQQMKRYSKITYLFRKALLSFVRRK